MSMDEIRLRMRQLGVTWETNAQVKYRLDWLQVAGVVTLTKSGWTRRG